MGDCVPRNLGGTDAAVVEGPPEPQRPDASVVDVSEEDAPDLTMPSATWSCRGAAPPTASAVVLSVGWAAAFLLGRRRRR